MARRRKATTRRSSSRGRVGFVSTGGRGWTNLLMFTGGAIAGGALAVKADQMIGDKLPPKGSGAVFLLAGGMLAKSAKEPFIQGVGVGLATAGGTKLLKGVGMLSGPGEDYYYDNGVDDYMSGAPGAMDDNQGSLDVMSGDDWAE